MIQQHMNFGAEKMFTFLKGFFSGANMIESKKALVFARQQHEGQRRTSGEPYIIHPLTMACEAISLGIRDDNILATILLHDTVEDCNISINDLPVSDDIKRSVSFLTFKVNPGETKEEAKKIYYQNMIKDRSAAICKVLDRCHNVSSMAGTFTDERLRKYIRETKQYIYPLLKQTKETYPEFSDALFVLKYQITSLIDSIEACIKVYKN